MVKSCESSIHGQPAKFWLSMIFAILLVASVIAIRPLERGSGSGGNSLGISESFMKDEFTISRAFDHTEEEAQRIEDEEKCQKNEDEDECLNRRSLAAHTDYIYTQNHKP